MPNSLWISCKEKLPADHGIFLTYHPGDGENGASTDIAFYDNDDKRFRGSYHGPVPASHWQPLPTPPEPSTLVCRHEHIVFREDLENWHCAGCHKWMPNSGRYSGGKRD